MGSWLNFSSFLIPICIFQVSITIKRCMLKAQGQCPRQTHCHGRPLLDPRSQARTACNEAQDSQGLRISNMRAHGPQFSTNATVFTSVTKAQAVSLGLRSLSSEGLHTASEEGTEKQETAPDRKDCREGSGGGAAGAASWSAGPPDPTWCSLRGHMPSHLCFPGAREGRAAGPGDAEHTGMERT